MAGPVGVGAVGAGCELGTGCDVGAGCEITGAVGVLLTGDDCDVFGALAAIKAEAFACVWASAVWNCPCKYEFMSNPFTCPITLL